MPPPVRSSLPSRLLLFVLLPLCLFRPAFPATSPSTTNPRLLSELKSLRSSPSLLSPSLLSLSPAPPPQDFYLQPLTPSLLLWQFTFRGPKGTPYARGLYT